MKRFVLALAAVTALAVPASAQTLSVVLPSLFFPEPVVTPSSMGCEPTVADAVCTPQE